jgi:hypothetical protein
MRYGFRSLRRYVAWPLLLAIGVLRTPHLAATSLIPLTFDELIAQAATIVRCDIVDVRSEWRETREERVIVTLVTIRVRSALKGSSRDVVQLEFPGGTIRDITLRVAGTPQFAAGDEEFLFINSGQTISPLVGFGLGRFSIHHDAFTHRTFVTSFDGKPFRGLVDFSRATRAAAQTEFPRTPIERAASVGLSDGDFESLVRNRLADLARVR